LNIAVSDLKMRVFKSTSGDTESSCSDSDKYADAIN
jgi:hypothetical protein